jgi:hypothetical protein
MTSAGPNGLLGVCMGTQFADYASGYPRQLAYWPPTGYPSSTTRAISRALLH